MMLSTNRRSAPPSSSPVRLTVGRHQVVEADVPENLVIHIGESEAVRLVGPNTPATIPGRVWLTDLKVVRYLAASRAEARLSS